MKEVVVGTGEFGYGLFKRVDGIVFRPACRHELDDVYSWIKEHGDPGLYVVVSLGIMEEVERMFAKYDNGTVTTLYARP